MSASHSRSARFLAGGFDLSNATNKVDVKGASDLSDATGFQNTSKVWVAGMKAATVQASGFWRGTADGSQSAVAPDVLSGEHFGVAGTVCVSHYPAGETVGNRGWALACTLTEFNVDTDTENVSSYSLGGESSLGMEPVVSHYAMPDATATALTGSGTATAVDNAAATTNGGAGYLHNFRLSAGTAVVVIQHSTNNSTWSDLVTFSNVVAATDERVSERVAVAGTVNRYTRCVYTITGGSASFHAGLARL